MPQAVPQSKTRRARIPAPSENVIRLAEHRPYDPNRLIPKSFGKALDMTRVLDPAYDIADVAGKIRLLAFRLGAIDPWDKRAEEKVAVSGDMTDAYLWAIYNDLTRLGAGA